MKMNEDCIRDILKFLVENLSITIDNRNNKGGFNDISMLGIMKTFESQYNKEDIWYSVYNLSQDRFIESNDIRKQSGVGFAFVEIYNVTHRGHQFYETIQSDNIWNKTKSVVSKVGVHTLNFVESVAHDVAVESAKQFIKSTCSTTNQT